MTLVQVILSLFEKCNLLLIFVQIFMPKNNDCTESLSLSHSSSHICSFTNDLSLLLEKQWMSSSNDDKIHNSQETESYTCTSVIAFHDMTHIQLGRRCHCAAGSRLKYCCLHLEVSLSGLILR